MVKSCEKVQLVKEQLELVHQPGTSNGKSRYTIKPVEEKLSFDKVLPCAVLHSSVQVQKASKDAPGRTGLLRLHPGRADATE